MPAVGFEPTISAGERPQTYALDRAATGPAEENAAFIFRVDVVYVLTTAFCCGSSVICQFVYLRVTFAFSSTCL